MLFVAQLGVVAVLVLAFLIFSRDKPMTVTAHFDRAVAVYPGTELRVMGVKIGEVTAVVPDGNSVRVEMTYDDEYKLPAGAKAAVVTPSLVADRFVQVFPAYAKGAVLPDNGEIPLDRTQTPIEIDRIYKALHDLSVTLGPQDGGTEGADGGTEGAAGGTEGALNNLLTAGAKALDGNGALGSKMIRNLSAAADTFASNRGPLFANVRALAEITGTLAEHDVVVQRFLADLTSVSGQLEGERDELRQVLAALGRALGTVKGFVAENREALGEDIELLSSILERVDRQKDALGLVAQKGALALGNLAVAYEPSTGTFGSRVQVAPGIMFRPDLFLCQTLVNAGAPQLVCDLLKGLLQPLLPATSGGAGSASGSAPSEPGSTGPGSTGPGSTGSAPADRGPTVAPAEPPLASKDQPPAAKNGPPSLFSLLGGDLL